MDNDKQDIINQMLSQLTDSAKHNREVYSKVAKHLDEGHKAGVNLSVNQMTKGIMEIYKDKETEELTALDVACGTGRCAVALRNEGWLGPIDGLDGCHEMLEVAKTKNVYRTLYHEMISLETPLSLEKSSYDLITCFGGLSFGHISHDCLEMLMGLLVSGGILVFSYSDYTNPGSTVQYKKSLEEKIEKLKTEYEIIQTDESYYPRADLTKMMGVVNIAYIRKP